MKQELIRNLQNLQLKDILEKEKSDSQYISLEKGYKLMMQTYYLKEKIIKLVIVNSIICYQLSKTGEEYWEEFSNFIKDNIENEKSLREIMVDFMNITKWNKRLKEVKLKRIEKICNFLENVKFTDLQDYYMNNQLKFLKDLWETMNQNIESKTILFSLKMFSFISRIIFKEIILFPKNILLPKDSRIEKITEEFNDKKEPYKIFWKNIGENLEYSLLHYDSFLWTK